MKRFLGATLVAGISIIAQIDPGYSQVPEYDNYKLSTAYCNAVIGTVATDVQTGTTQKDNGSNSDSSQRSDSNYESVTKKGNGGLSVLNIVGLGGGGSSERVTKQESDRRTQSEHAWDQDATSQLVVKTTDQKVLAPHGDCTAVSGANANMGIAHLQAISSITNTQTTANADITMNRDRQVTQQEAIASNERINLTQINAQKDIDRAKIQLQGDMFLFSTLLNNASRGNSYGAGYGLNYGQSQEAGKQQ